MTPAKWMVLALLASVGLVGAGWLLCHGQAVAQRDAAMRHADSVESGGRDSLAALNRALVSRDSAATADSLLASRLSGTHALDLAAVASAQREVAAGQLLLAASSTDANRVVVYRDQIVPALELEVSDLRVQVVHSDSSSTAWHSAFTNQVQATAALQEIANSKSDENFELHQELFKQSAIPVVSLSFWPRVGRVAETAAIAAATIRACDGHPLSVGCLAGVFVTGRRLVKP